MSELFDPLCSRLSMKARRIAVDVVRIDLKRNKTEGLCIWRPDDGHIVSRLDCRAGYVRPGTPTNIGCTSFNTVANSLQNLRIVQALKKMKAVSAADGDRLSFAHSFDGIRIFMD